jgi:hypothetical protein
VDRTLKGGVVSDSLRSARMVAVAALAVLLFGFPFMAVFDLNVRVLGVPLLWTYLFVSWGVVIAIVAWSVRDTE